MTTPKEKISVRWGIPALDDKGGLYVYGFMLRNYAKAKITRDEFLCIQHLAAYHYESANGESSPSLITIAEQMGYEHPNSVRRLVASLEEKGMLEIEHRPGETSVYNLHGFASKMLTLTSQCDTTPTLECEGSLTSQCEGVSHPSVTEEEEETKKSKSKKKEKESAANAAIPQSPKSPKKKSDSHPNTQPIMAAFVECLPEALRGTFDYRANGKWAKVLAQIEVLKPSHIKTYYAQMRAQWNKSPKMRDTAITFYALYQYILAAAQNSTLAELETPAAAYERAIERTIGLDAEERAELLDARAQERAEAAPDPVGDAWARVAEQMRLTQIKDHMRQAVPVDLSAGVLTVGVYDPDWLNARADRLTCDIARRAGLVAVRWVARVGGGV